MGQAMANTKSKVVPMKTPHFLTALLTLPLCLLCGCASSQPDPARMYVKEQYPQVKREVLRAIKDSLPQRDWMFEVLLAKVNHPYHERKPGTNRLELGVTQSRGFARGVSESDLGRSNVREYALVDTRIHVPGDREKAYGIWRVFVRDRRVIYMEFSSIGVSTFHSHFRPVN
jgi:hypothetical protein